MILKKKKKVVTCEAAAVLLLNDNATVIGQVMLQPTTGLWCSTHDVMCMARDQ